MKHIIKFRYNKNLNDKYFPSNLEESTCFERETVVCFFVFQKKGATDWAQLQTLSLILLKTIFAI